MVVPPVGIFGATATSYMLAKDLYVLVKDIKNYPKDLQGLGESFKASEEMFNWLVKAFGEIKQHIVPQYFGFIEEISNNLRTKLATIKEDINKSKVWSWPFVKSSLESAVEALNEWVSRFFDRFVLLPDELKKKLEDKLVTPEYKAERDGPLAKLQAHIEMKATELRLDQTDVDKILNTIKPEPLDTEQRNIWQYRYRKDLIRVPEHIRTNEIQLKSLKLEVARLAAVLKAADPRLTHLPKAVSWFQRQDPGESTPRWFGIAYETRVDVTTQYDLKEVIKMRPIKHSLSNRIELALDFVGAMAYIRGLEWVHKAVRSKNVKLCYDLNHTGPPHGLGYVNLVGFNVARRGTGERQSTSEDNQRHWEDQVYAHPDRQTVNVMADDIRAADEEHANSMNHGASNLLSPVLPPTGNGSGPMARKPNYYRYMHDIYSIGVVLLEIGLWEDITLNVPGLREKQPEERKIALLQKAKEDLPITVGKRYAAVVKLCLEANDDGPEVADVLSRLAQIQL